MFRRRCSRVALEDRGPLRVLFTITSMPVGGAEVLLMNLVRRMDRQRFQPEVCCLKEPGPLGEQLSAEVPVHSQLLTSKYDVRVLGRLERLIRQRRIDAVITVGAGDKMFWGRLAAWRTGVPVVFSALHSTGWPDGIDRLNRWITPLTDRFIAVARRHGQYLVEVEGLPAGKVAVVPNGVDTERFRPNPAAREAVRRDLMLHADVPVFGIVAALRPEKNHLLFLRMAAMIRQQLPDARFLIVGDGPQRTPLELAVASAGLGENVLMLGTRENIPDLLAAMDVFVLTSRMEANPVSILEAMSTGLPVVASRVGSISETVEEGATGYLIDYADPADFARKCLHLAAHPEIAQALGSRGRSAVAGHWSLECMVGGYERLIEEVYRQNCGEPGAVRPALPVTRDAPAAPIDPAVPEREEIDSVVGRM